MIDGQTSTVNRTASSDATARLREIERVTEMPPPDGIRDTIESIVVAFILAFVFRAFVVEAFVIPTGSMAPGLYGQHGEYRCELCQYPMVYGLHEDRPLPRQFQVTCPNCGYSEGRNATLNSDGQTVVPSSGDRILVLKWPYDIGSKWLGPHRWDVVVFKDPQEGDQNYIKRLLGLPGDVLEVIDGDVYAAPSDSVPADIREALSKPPSPGRSEARRLNQEQEERLAKILKIQRKTRVAQESLWMLHYDNDYKPNVSGLPVVPPFVPAWTPEDRQGSPWDTSTSRVKFKPTDTREHLMQLTGKPIADDYGYNNVQGMPRSPHYVGDVRVRFVLVPGAAQGSLSLELRKGSDSFVVHLAADGTAQLYRLGVGPVPVELCKAKTEPLVPLRPVTIEFENVDYRVTLRVNDVEIVATGDSQYSPNAAALLRGAEQITPGPQASVRIGATEMPLELRHLAVHRDVYYRSDVALDDGQQGKRNPLARYPGWGTATNPIQLRADPPDYFCMGDNSPQSMDGRLWWKVSPLLDARGDYQNGTVPGDQMIGRAFFVYWPGGYRFSKDTPAVIPNVGKMRIIR